MLGAFSPRSGCIATMLGAFFPCSEGGCIIIRTVLIIFLFFFYFFTCSEGGCVITVDGIFSLCCEGGCVMTVDGAFSLCSEGGCVATVLSAFFLCSRRWLCNNCARRIFPVH